MRQLVPIKVKIGLADNGHAAYPDFNAIDPIIRKGQDWSNYVDTFGLGWHYDKQSGHRENTQDSPIGQQWGVLVVPKDFADAAADIFPETVAKLTETELEEFYDNKAHAHEPDEDIDQQVLVGIQAKQSLGLPLTEQQNRALDPDDTVVPGIRKNKKKLWKDFKVLTDTEIIG